MTLECCLHQVFLNVYDVVGDQVSIMKGVNNMLKAFGTGAYHLAVQLYGREWSFGGTQADVSGAASPGTLRTQQCCVGVYYAEPRGGEPHKFRKSLYMGSTSLSQPEVPCCWCLDGR